MGRAVKRALPDDRFHAAKKPCRSNEGVSDESCLDLDLTQLDLYTQVQQFLRQIGLCAGVHAAAHHLKSARCHAMQYSQTWLGLSESSW